MDSVTVSSLGLFTLSDIPQMISTEHGNEGANVYDKHWRICDTKQYN